MQTYIIPAEEGTPLDRVYSISITIRTFKGRRNVEAHVFRCDPDLAEAASYDWNTLVGPPMDPANPGDVEDVKRTLLETFTAEERDAVVSYLSRRYGSRIECITACPVELPIPLGVTPLSSITPGKTLGFIRFENVTDYPLPFAVRGFYDLTQHDPLDRQGGEEQA
ncbi:hypothetical protein [Desulfovibrio subterraneus]|uniref:Uncharacterized protein n=1 Tax=Desulfovibrio subterraneus TaxID=2718620 RepID=A0A7J0BKG2_9BACT|nr:hypothetical protein [Desulfovibrio subterraneus]GFM34129.1 hypothetical protein DSM101010T_24940 [Desulfovibrio subterraneus]